MKDKLLAKATIQVILEVRLSQGWGDNCTVSQVFSQGSREAIQRVSKLLVDDKGDRLPRARGIAILGNPKVLAVVAEEEK